MQLFGDRCAVCLADSGVQPASQLGAGHISSLLIHFGPAACTTHGSAGNHDTGQLGSVECVLFADHAACGAGPGDTTSALSLNICLSAGQRAAAVSRQREQQHSRRLVVWYVLVTDSSHCCISWGADLSLWHQHG